MAAGFEGLASGALDPARFFASPGALPAPGTVGPSLCYDTDAGRLVFDANGSAEGERYVLALLLGAPSITAADILVIG